MIKNTYNNFWIIFSIILYKIALDYSYELVISNGFEYAGLGNHFTTGNYIISWCFLLTFIPFILRINRKITYSNSVLLLLTAISLVPSTTLIAYLNFETKFIILLYIYWFCFFSYDAIFTRFRIKENGNKRNFILISFLLCASVIYVSWKYTGFRFHWGIKDVYDLRLEAREYDIGAIVGYLATAADKLLPVILIYCILKKKNILSMALIFVILLNFGIAGSKGVLFSLFLCILGFYFFKYRRSLYVFSICALLSTWSVIEYIFFKQFLVGFIVYRILLIPSQLNYYYYDFFKDNELDFFRQGFLRHFGFESPYKGGIEFLIGTKYFNDYQTRANNGLFTDAYYNCGIIGILLFPLILVFLLKLIESVSNGVDERLMFVPVYMVALAFLSTTFTTALLTHGLLLLMLMLYYIPRNKENYQ
ncbi:hypothetical protein [Gabonibacter chumensis]|uniref:hypothetical protein n=1 Tax=Gabonibacter chumensis TaxID=2972474 RepID=UPI0025744028|nr:hypothetical protein [Gabonibacter chumensis]MCR9012817.1 hypothetical protein [Gabonibacter chumensis]